MTTKLAYKQYKIPITTANSFLQTEVELPQEAKKVVGIRLDADRENMLYVRGGARIEISNNEIFPDEFPCKFLMFGKETPASERLHALDVSIATNKMKITHKDIDSPSLSFSAYSLIIIVAYEA